MKPIRRVCGEMLTLPAPTLRDGIATARRAAHAAPAVNVLVAVRLVLARVGANVHAQAVPEATMYLSL